MNDKARIIDDALKDTVNKYYLDVKSNKKLCNLYIQLISNIVEGNFECITTIGNARNNLRHLGTTVILMELMKNIIKVNSFYNKEKDYKPIKTDKTLDSEELTVEEIEFLIYKEILKSNSDIVFSKMLNNPKVLLGSIISFVESRYNEKTKIDNIDVVRDYNDLMLLSQINRSQDELIG